MEGEKRRREDNGEVERKRTKGEDVNAVAGQTVTEDEVEEFYAILRRIHAAVKYFEEANKQARRKLTDTGWRPCFEAEDFNEYNGVNNASVNNNQGLKEEGVEEEGEEDSGLDLNSNPTSSTSKSIA